MLFDFLVLNLTSIYLASILLSVFKLNDKKLYFILIVDLILHNFPIITISIIGIHYLNNMLFKYLADTFIMRLILITVYYFIFGIFIYGFYNGINSYIFLLLWQNLFINVLIYFLGLKYLNHEYS